ncbi:hypothetical protein E2C01_043954 [Portunus trituberculatus]|uniref:Uncharacterized protein n=1 Tax=Portunus trituberculatus TaxID=210409 RepID=A0A5B7FUA2_PORTR|nr:hypothetical protein [Portunus trituberculatus]
MDEAVLPYFFHAPAPITNKSCHISQSSPSEFIRDVNLRQTFKLLHKLQYRYPMTKTQVQRLNGKQKTTKQVATLYYLGKYFVHSLAIKKITLIEGDFLASYLLNPSECSRTAVGEVVNGNDFISFIQQVNNAVGPNVACATRHKHSLLL